MSLPIRCLRVVALAAVLLAASPALAQPADGLPPPTIHKLLPEKNAAGNYVFYRRVSDWEKLQLLRRKGLFITPGAGESFISSSRAYVDDLGSRHPKDYANLMVIEVAPEALAEMEKAGLRAPGPLLEKLYPKMPEMTANKPSAIHFKAELGALNLGFRPGSIEILNRHLRSLTVDKTARLAFKAEERSIKERVRRTIPGLEKKAAKEKTRGVAEILDRRVNEKTKPKEKGRAR